MNNFCPITFKFHTLTYSFWVKDYFEIDFCHLPVKPYGRILPSVLFCKLSRSIQETDLMERWFLVTNWLDTPQTPACPWPRRSCLILVNIFCNSCLYETDRMLSPYLADQSAPTVIYFMIQWFFTLCWEMHPFWCQQQSSGDSHPNPGNTDIARWGKHLCWSGVCINYWISFYSNVLKRRKE